MESWIKRHPLLWCYLYFAWFSVPYHLTVYASGMSGWSGWRQALLMSCLWLIPLLLVPRLARPIAAVTGLVLLPASLVSIGYWLIYGQEFSQSVLYIIFESNLSEGSEFVGSYLRLWHVPVFALFAGTGFWLWWRMPTLQLPLGSRARWAVTYSRV